MANWFDNGEALEHLAIDDRGFQYGDGLFETVAIRNGAPRLWEFHLERLARGCELLRITMPRKDRLLRAAMDAVGGSNVSSAYCIVKIIVSAGASRRGYGRKLVKVPSVLCGVFPSSPPPLKLYRDGTRAVLCQTRLALDSVVRGVKTLNRIEQVLARSEFNAADVFEGLTMDADGNIICGTMSNVFFVKNKTVSTPSLQRCGVAGVMRRHVIETLQAQGTGVATTVVSAADFGASDEVFVSNSQFGVMPLSGCANWDWGVGPITRKVMQTMADSGVAECRL